MHSNSQVLVQFVYLFFFGPPSSEEGPDVTAGVTDSHTAAFNLTSINPK